MTTPGNASSNLSGKPPVVDLATWLAAREVLLEREKAHTREGDAIAAARRRLPMVEVDGTVEVTGAAGPVPFLDLFEGRDERQQSRSRPAASINRRVCGRPARGGWRRPATTTSGSPGSTSTRSTGTDEAVDRRRS